MREGIVVKSTGSWYKVLVDEREIVDCKIKGKFRIDNLKSTNPIAVGDIVHFEQEKDGTGMISTIVERKNYIIRKASNLSKQSHIIAANIDRAYLIATINYPETLSLFIDRFLVSAEAYNIPVTIIFNKIDLYNDHDMQKYNEWKDIYENIGYSTIATSAKTGENIETLKNLMCNKINLLAGNSGVGKTSLVNTIDNALNLKTLEVSKHNKKGQHTTTFAEMFKLSSGGYIIDTPGLKAFGLLDMEKWEISHYFPEMFERLKDCQFHNCKHVHEPGCNVIKAVEAGQISIMRYNNYLSLMETDDDNKYRAAF
ncbi:MAG: ribosome small subunit-dependent GTPase A [Bacteroidales bacterium]|nr:ribosome small subunit-dependent GTPase A [Bacteroidales bacterium]